MDFVAHTLIYHQESGAGESGVHGYPSCVMITWFTTPKKIKERREERGIKQNIFFREFQVDLKCHVKEIVTILIKPQRDTLSH